MDSVRHNKVLAIMPFFMYNIGIRDKQCENAENSVFRNMRN